MKKDLYREALQEGWQFVWEHKILWVLGLFATFLGQMGIEDVFAQIGFFKIDSGIELTRFPFIDGLRQLYYIAMNLPGPQEWAGFIWLITMIGGLMFFLLFLALVSQGTIIHCVAQSMVKKKKKLDISKAWHIGVFHSPKLLALNAIRIIVVSLLATLTGWISYHMAQTGALMYSILTILSIILTIGIGLILSFLVIYAASYVIIDHRGLGDAMQAAWQLFKKHKAVSFEVGGILLFLNLILSIIAIAGLLVFFTIPTFLIWILSAEVGGLVIGAGIFGGIIVSTMFILLIGSIFTTFSTAVWTNLFLHMHKKGIASRVTGWWKSVFAR